MQQKRNICLSYISHYNILRVIHSSMCKFFIKSANATKTKPKHYNMLMMIMVAMVLLLRSYIARLSVLFFSCLSSVIAACRSATIVRRQDRLSLTWKTRRIQENNNLGKKLKTKTHWNENSLCSVGM
jgi:hypothetical protein